MYSEAPKQKGGIALLVGGTIAAVIAAIVLAAGGTAIWTDVAKRDDNGYFSTHTHHFQASTRAITTGRVTIGSEVPDWLIGKVRLEASSRKSVFVGIARKADVDAYLAGVAHTEATKLDLDPFKVTYVAKPGSAKAGRPAGRSLWAASASGAGTSSLTWKIKSGEWSIVVMNADGSPGVSADVTAGAQIPALIWAAIGISIFGALLLAGAVLMLLAGMRRQSATQTAGAPAPAL